MQTAAEQMKPQSRPSKRTMKLAAKVLASDGVAPARLQVKDGDFWVLQWLELRALARAAIARAMGDTP